MQISRQRLAIYRALTDDVRSVIGWALDLTGGAQIGAALVVAALLQGQKLSAGLVSLS